LTNRKLSENAAQMMQQKQEACV